MKARQGERGRGRHEHARHVLLGIALGICALAGLDLVLMAWHDLEDVLDAPRLEQVESVERNVPAAPGDARFLQLVSLLTFTPMAPGNGVELFTTGAATFPRVWADLRAARRTITVQQYYCGPGRVADSLRAALTERARAGVRVLFLWDGFGCKDLGGDYFSALRAAGVETLPFRPVHWYSLHRSQHRSHLRVVVVDGRVGWVGGAGFDDKWWTGTGGEPPWRDTNVRFTGPAVRTLQAAFANGWAEASGRILAGPSFFPDSLATPALPASSAQATSPPPPRSAQATSASRAAGASTTMATEPAAPAGALAGGSSAVAGVLLSSPEVEATAAERFLAVTTEAARRRLWITNPYFLPSAGLRDVLAQAARRGVDVRILTAGPKIDVPLLRSAARSYYDQLLHAGVRIWEYQPAMIHAKTLVVDDAWSTVGTLNFDERSLRLNAEATLLVQDPATAADLGAVFLSDLARAREVRVQDFDRRSGLTRLWERACRLFAPFL